VGYCYLLANGWDTWGESADVELRPAVLAMLERAKAEAAAVDERGGAPLSVEVEGETLQLAPHGGRAGNRFLLSCDDFSVDIRDPSTSFPVSLRYNAAGLWEHGLGELQRRVRGWLLRWGSARGDGWCRVSTAHYAFDWFSPEFSEEMKDVRILNGFVFHSSTKQSGHCDFTFYRNSRALQTVTIGSKANLQIQLYDKSREITEASGKTWMHALWDRTATSDGIAEPIREHVWRLELRFGSEFLANRDMRRPDDVERERDRLVSEALFSRRLTSPIASDSNNRRWPMHPLWVATAELAGAPDMLPIGRYVTGRRDVLLDRAARQIAGAVRSATVLSEDDWDPETAAEILRRARELIDGDPEHEAKVAKARERYRFVDEAKD
jgi:hypothetical protein